MPQPILGAIAVVERAGKILLVQRKNPPNADTWGFPGGKVEWGETCAAAAARELEEETGVIAAAQRHLISIDAIGHDAGGQVSYHYLLVAVECAYQHGTPKAADDAKDAAWFTPEEVRGLNTSPRVEDVMAILAR